MAKTIEGKRPQTASPTKSAPPAKDEGAERLIRITKLVGNTAQAMSGREMNDGPLELFTQDLAPYPEEAIAKALAACRREIKSRNGFPPTLVLADVLERIGLVTGDDKEAAASIAAWELVMMVAKRFVTPDGSIKPSVLGAPVEGCMQCNGDGLILHPRTAERNASAGPCTCRPVIAVPEISERILDVVERMGGWTKFKDISETSFPFVKRDFFEGFRLWRKVERYRSRIPLGEGLPDRSLRLVGGTEIKRIAG